MNKRLFTIGKFKVEPRYLSIARNEITKAWPPDDSAPQELKEMNSEDIARIIKKINQINSSVWINIKRRDLRIALALCKSQKNKLTLAWKKKVFDIINRQKRPFGIKVLFGIYQYCFESKPLKDAILKSIDSYSEQNLPYIIHKSVFFSEYPPISISKFILDEKLDLLSFPDILNLEKRSPLSKMTRIQILKAANKEYINLHASETLEDICSSEDVECTLLLLDKVVELYVTGDMDRTEDIVEFDKNPKLGKIFQAAIQNNLLGNIKENEVRWQNSSERVKKWALRWLVYHKIEEFFGKVDANPERKEFWHGYVREISDYDIFPNIPAFAMKIGNLYFIEFGDIGNACYVYTPDIYREINGDYQRYPSQDPASLKNKRLVLEGEATIYYRGYPHTIKAPLNHRSGKLTWFDKFSKYIEEFSMVSEKKEKIIGYNNIFLRNSINRKSSLGVVEEIGGLFKPKEKKERKIQEGMSCKRHGCTGKLILRSGRYGKFYGCSNYPRCRENEKYQK